MTKTEAIKAANKIAKILGSECVVIKVKRKWLWYFPKGWFSFFDYENVSRDYVNNYEFTGKIYYSTKK